MAKDFIYTSLMRKDFLIPENLEFFEWWSLNCNDPINKDLKPRETAWLINNLIHAEKVMHGSEFIGAAGIIYSQNKYQKKILYRNHNVVEFISHYVDPRFRKKDISDILLDRRTEV